MTVRDVAKEVRETIGITELIEKVGGGTFQRTSEESPFRGMHNKHAAASSSDTHLLVDPRTNSYRCYSCGERGTIIDWVIQERFNGDKRAYVDAVCWVADTYGISTGGSHLDAEANSAYTLLTEAANAANKRLLESEPVLAFIMAKWGITRETVIDLTIGLAGASPDIAMADADQVGMLKNGQYLLADRILWPHFIQNKVRYITSRYVGDPPEGTAKVIGLQNKPFIRKTLYNFDTAFAARKGASIIFTEGYADAALAYQEGIPAVAVCTNVLESSMIDDAISLCHDARVVYIVFDTEVHRRGEEGALSTAQVLVNRGFNPYIVRLPAGDRQHVDLNEYLRDAGSTAFRLLLSEGYEEKKVDAEGKETAVKHPPMTLADIRIAQCPVQPHALDLAKVVSSFASLPVCETYAQKFSKESNIKIGDIKKAMVRAKKVVDKIHDLVIVDKYEDPPYMAQDYRFDQRGDTWYSDRTVWIPYRVTTTANEEEISTVQMLPTHIKIAYPADGRYIVEDVRPYKTGEVPLTLMGRLPPECYVNQDVTRLKGWSSDTEQPYSLVNFQANRCGYVSTSEMFTDVRRLIDTFVIYPDPADAALVALFVMYSYLYMGFSTVPYLNFQGQPGSGKSTSMSMMAKLCFNSIVGTIMTEAGVCTALHTCRGTLILDQAEEMYAAGKGTRERALIQLCLGSYVKNETAQKHKSVPDMATGGWTPSAEFTFGPKVFGAVAHMPPILGTRCLVVYCRTATKNMPSFDDYFDQHKDDVQQLKDKLQVWACCNFRKIREMYQHKRATFAYKQVKNRKAQLWSILFSMGEVIQEEGVPVMDSLFALERAKSRQAAIFENEHDEQTQVCNALYEMLTDGSGLVPLLDFRGAPHIPLSTAASAVTSRLVRAGVWRGEKQVCDPKTLAGMLRNVGSIKQGTPSITRKGPSGASESHTPFHIEALAEYCKRKEEEGKVEVILQELDTCQEEL